MNIQNFNNKLSEIHDKINNYNREIIIIAVSKTVCSNNIHQAYLSGITNFAENYAQELVSKAQELTDLKITWHFIGQIQSNKLKSIAQYSSYVHSLYQESHIIKLNNYAKEFNKKIKILIQINPINNLHKGGIIDKVELLKIIELSNRQSNLELIGLMMVSSSTDELITQQEFASLYKLQQELLQENQSLTQLSIGMSHDYEIALDNGATMLRIGSLLFGKRTYS